MSLASGIRSGRMRKNAACTLHSLFMSHTARIFDLCEAPASFDLVGANHRLRTTVIAVRESPRIQFDTTVDPSSFVSGANRNGYPTDNLEQYYRRLNQMLTRATATEPYIQYLAAADILELVKYWSGCEDIQAVPLNLKRKHKPVIQIIPNVTEVEWSSDGKDTNGDVLIEGGTEPVLRVVRSVLLSKVDIRLSRLARKAPDYVLWSGNAQRFLQDTLPQLPRNSVIVSHGLFMQLRLCRDRPCVRETVPNGGVLCLVCPAQNNKIVFVVRHCPTCDNVSRHKNGTLEVAQTGTSATRHLRDSANTMCVCVSPLRPLKLLMNVMHRLGVGANVYCSPLPRAVVTAAALVCNVSSKDLRKLQKKFWACPTPPSAIEVEAYLKEKNCSGGVVSPYC